MLISNLSMFKCIFSANIATVSFIKSYSMGPSINIYGKVIIKTLYPENRSWMPDFEVWHPIFCWIFSRKWSNNINFGRTK